MTNPTQPNTMPLFGKSHKSPQELLKTLRESLYIMSHGDRDDKKVAKVRAVFSKLLAPHCSITLLGILILKEIYIVTVYLSLSGNT